MGRFQVSKKTNAVVTKRFGDNRIPTKRCVPFVGSLKVKKVIHTTLSNPLSNVDEKIIAQKIHFLKERKLERKFEKKWEEDDRTFKRRLIVIMKIEVKGSYFLRFLKPVQMHTRGFSSCRLPWKKREVVKFNYLLVLFSSRNIIDKKAVTFS
jgi:hypothetical protein